MGLPKNKTAVSGNKQENFVTVVLLLAFWLAISLPSDIFSPEGFTSLLQHLIVGLLLALLINRLIKLPVFTAEEIEEHRLPNIIRLIGYAFYLITQIIAGGIDVAQRVMRPQPRISPGLVKFHTPLTDDLQITLNANSITLTPGTITIDIEKTEQGCTFWVHSISRSGLDTVKKDKGFLEKITHIYRK